MDSFPTRRSSDLPVLQFPYLYFSSGAAPRRGRRRAGKPRPGSVPYANFGPGAVQGRFFRDRIPHWAIQLIDSGSHALPIVIMGTREFPIIQEYIDNMVQMTEKAIGKVKEIMGSQDPSPNRSEERRVGTECR